MRDRSSFSIVEKLGAERCEIERPDLSKHIAEAKNIDRELDLVGNSVLLDSLAMLRRGGRSCLAGFLGGLVPVPDFNPLLQMSSGVHFSFFGSFVFGTPGFPLSDVPLQQIAADAAAGRLDVKPSRIFRFEEIREGSSSDGGQRSARQDGGRSRLRLSDLRNGANKYLAAKTLSFWKGLKYSLSMADRERK
jgi:NADPH:quinone reductase-like Zn-dependent oxidoreductase